MINNTHTGRITLVILNSFNLKTKSIIIDVLKKEDNAIKRKIM